MSKKATYKQLLIDLKQKLDKGEMSTLVGAGFSKNIDRSFPDWAELIHQMVLFSEEKRLERIFKEHFSEFELISDEYQDYLYKEVRAYIEQIGPLKAVSDYIRLKGFREAADFLIEENTPVIEVTKGKRYLRTVNGGKKTRRLLSDADIACHTKLVNLPWNNIFTTNYDNLLETCIDINSKEEIKKEIANLERKISQRKSGEKTMTDEIKKLSAELENAKEKLLIEEQRFGTGSAEAQPVEKLIEEIKKKLQESKNKLKFESYFLESDLPRLQNLNDIQQNFRTTVVHSSELALKKNQNIIKIHGSIRLDNKKPFGFDGDVAKNYVISQQDYDSYGEKHEAFMQLMRITLLQESFCLFGFSGIDPNFLGWISWVRDVLQKKPSGDSGNHKIYMIDVWEDDADPAKTMFYRNHQIAFIPLGSPSCIAFLEEVTGKRVADNSPKARINLLLDYLSADLIPGADKISFEVLKQSEYQGVWEGMPFYRLDGNKLTTFLNKTEKIFSLKYYSRLPLLYGMTDSSQQNFLIRFRNWHEEVKHDQSMTLNLLKLSLMMLQEIYLPVSRLLGEDIDQFRTMLDLSKEFPGLYEQFALVDLKDAVWANDAGRFGILVTELKNSANPEVHQELNYQRALFATYNFDFKLVKQLLTEWMPIGHWAMKKAGLQSQLSIPDAIQTLKGVEQPTVQETAYKYHILSYLYAANDLRSSGEQQYKIVRGIDKGGLRSFDLIIKRLLKGLKAKPEKITPYGAETFTITTYFSSDENTGHRSALQLLNLLLETGHPLRLSYVTHLTTQEAYEPLKLSVYWYPEVVLFFALQYSEEKFLTRIAQDLIYENHIAGKLPAMAGRMMNAYFNQYTPRRIKASMLVVLSEFINVLETSDWQGFYLKVWKDEISQGVLTDDIKRRKQDFLTKGIALITDTQLAEEIIETLLTQFLAALEQQVRDNVIHFLYQFSKNAYLNSIVKGTGLHINSTIFDDLIERLKDDVFFLFVLGNISFSFSQDQVDKVKNILSEMNAFENANPRLWRVILFFGDGDPGIETRVKEGVLKSEAVWRSGINLSNTSYSSYRNAIKLSSLREYRSGRNLQWNDLEIKTLYEQLRVEIDKIYHWPRYSDHAFEFSDLIKEMKIFLATEESVLKNLDGHAEVKRKVFELYQLEGQGVKNISAILGNDKSKIIVEIEKVSEEIYKKSKVEENIDLIEALLYKLLLQKEPALPASLIAISNWFYYKREEKQLKKFKERLEMILQMYSEEINFDIDAPALEQSLIKIAIVLEEWGAESGSIVTAKDLLENSRYNSIRYNLKSELNETY